MRMTFAIKSVAASVMLMTVSTAAMAAVDANKVTDLLKAKAEASGAKLEVASSELSGSNVVVKGAKLTFKDAKPVELGDVTLENVTEEGDGYLVGKVAAPATEKVDGDTKVNFKGASINNVHLMPAKADDAMSSFMLYDSMDFAGLEVAEKGTKVFAIGSGKATMSPYKPNEKIDMDGAVNDIYINFGTVTDPQMKQAVEAMGYKEVTGKVTMKGSWNPTDGRMSLPEMTYDFNNVGKLNIAMDISGYTPAFAKQLQDLTKSMESKSGGEQSAAMMGLVQQLTFNGMSIRFDDASLTNKIIDYVAKQSNQPREAIVAQGKGMAPMLAMALQDANIIKNVSDAVSAYLDSPKNLEIKAAPATPMSFAVLAASGMSAPAQLAKQIGLTVTANQ